MTSRTFRTIATIATFAALFIAGQIVVAQSAGDDSGEAVGNTFTPVGPMIGDRLEYTVTSDTAAAPPLRLEWAAGEPLRLPDGTTAEIQELRQAGRPAEFLGQPDSALMYVAGTQRLVGFRENYAGAYASSGSAGPLPINVTSAYDVELQAVVFLEHDAMPSCLHGGLLAGLRLQVGDGVQLPPCAMFASYGPFSLYSPQEFFVVATAREQVDGQFRLRLDAAQGGQAAWSAWIADGAPYPVAMECHCSAGFGSMEEPTLLRFDLTGLERGTQPFGASTTPAQGEPPMPTVASAATQRILIDEQGVDLPFPLAEAVYGPTGLGASPQVAAFLLDHPDAVVAWARLHNVRNAGVLRAEWTYQLADQTAGLAVFASRVVPEGPLAAAQQAPAAVVEASDDAPWPFGLPAHAPRLADLAALHAWHGGGAIDSYAYTVVPDGEGGHLAHIDLGHESSRTDLSVDPSSPALTQATGNSFEQTSFDLAGTALSYVRILIDGGVTQSPGTPLSEPPSEESDEEAGSRPVLAGVLGGGWPAPEVAAVAAGASLLVWIGLGLKSSPLLGLFSRLKEDQLLDHPARRRIHDAVTAQPGIHFKELARRTEIPNGSLVHHCRALEAGGLLSVRRLQGYSCYFPGSNVTASATSAAALKSEGARRVLTAIANQPALSSLDVGRGTGLAPATVHHHVQRLSEAGLVRQERAGRSLRLEATAQGQAALKA